MRKYSLLFIIALFLMPSITTYGQLKCYSLKAPELTIEGMKKIAVMSFENRKDVNWSYYSSENNYGAQLSDYMLQDLLKEHRGVRTEKDKVKLFSDQNLGTTSGVLKGMKSNKKIGKNYMDRYKINVYTIVDRAEMDNILAEQQLGASGAISDGDATELGKLLGLDVIITGGYSSDIKTSSKRSNGTSNGKPTVRYTVKKVAVFEATMKIISIETGEILGMTTKSITKKSNGSGSSSSEAYGNVASDQKLITVCLKTLSMDLVSYFAPVFTYQALEIEKPKVKDYKDEFKAAKEEVEAKNLSAAFTIIKEVYDADPYDAAMAHNMGVLYEAVGNFDQSITYHQTAYELDDSKQHKASLERALDSKEALVELGNLGIDTSPYVFDKKAGEKLNITKVKTKGSKKDRYKVFADSNKGGDVLANIPGDTEFVMLGQEGDWYKIKLLGGKEGYIHSDNID